MTDLDISEQLTTFTNLIIIPLPSPHAPTRLTAHLTLFKGPSVLLWCGECSNAYDSPRLTNSKTVSDTMMIEQHHPEQVARPQVMPTARLISEWAVAMTNARNQSTISTALYRTNADLAQPMSARLSKRFQLSQIILSLSLPSSITESLEGSHDPAKGSKSLLMIEGALKDIIKEVLSMQ